MRDITQPERRGLNHIDHAGRSETHLSGCTALERLRPEIVPALEVAGRRTRVGFIDVASPDPEFADSLHHSFFRNSHEDSEKCVASFPIRRGVTDERPSDLDLCWWLDSFAQANTLAEAPSARGSYS